MKPRPGPTRVCPVCGAENRPTDGFCPDCGGSLADVALHYPPASTLGRGATRSGSGYFHIPAYLQSESVIRRQRQRRRVDPHDAGAGGGMIWIGFLALAGSLVGSVDTAFARGVWTAGLLAAILGFWRMRHDLPSLERVGMVTGAIAVTVLGIIGGQLVIQDRSASEDRLSSVARVPTRAPDWTETVTTTSGSASAGVAPRLTGVSMFRGGPARTGEHPGPGPVGGPALAWRLDTAGEVYSSAAVVNGIVYLGSKSGFLYALDAATGNERWRTDLGDFIIRSSPAVVDRTVYVGVGFALVALDASTGTERWRYTTRYAGQSSPVVADGVVYIGSQEKILYAVDARTGEKRWEFESGGVVFSSPAVADGTLYFGGDDGDLYALDAKTGRPRWDFATGGAVFASPAVAGNTVYVTSTSHFLYAIDTTTGEERWRVGVGGEASPAVVDGVVYVGADDGGLYAIDTATHKPRWLVATGKPIHVSPTVAGDTVYVGSGSVLYAVDLATGARRWSYAAGDDLISSPTVAGGVVFVGSRDGYLYAIGSDGRGPRATPVTT